MPVQNINTGGILDKEPTQNLTNQGYVPVLTPEKMTPATPIKIAEPEPTPTFDPTSIEVPEIQMTEPEKVQSAFSERLRQANMELLGESGYRAEQENKQGMAGLLKTQTDLSAQLKAIQNEAQQIPLQMQQEATGRGITAGGLAPLQTARLRTNAIQALGVNSLLESSKGNIALAQTLVDRAVAQRFDPIKAEINALEKNLKLIVESPEYSIADKNRANAQLAIQEARKNAIANQEAEQKEIWSMANEAAKNGADALTLQKIQKAGTKEEALQYASQYLGAGTRFEQLSYLDKQKQQDFENSLNTGEYNLQKQDIENKLKQQAFENNVSLEKLKLSRDQFASDNEYRNAQLVLDQIKLQQSQIKPEYVKIGDKTYQQNPDGTLTTPEIPQEIAEATALQKEAGDIAEALLNNFNPSYVGKFGGAKAGTAKFIGGSAASDWYTQFDNLVAKLQLDNVKYLKGQGQVSDAERKILKDASTTLKTNNTPEQFKRTLQEVKTVLGDPGGIEIKDDGTYIYKNLDGTIHKGRVGDNYKDVTAPKLNLNFSEVGGDTNIAISIEKIGNKSITANQELLNRLKMADNDFFNETGKHISVNQSFRTKAQQQELYDKLSKKGARVAPPGRSFHEKGLAVDISNWKEAEKYLKKYGLLNNLPDDRGHFSYGEFA